MGHRPHESGQFPGHRANDLALGLAFPQKLPVSGSGAVPPSVPDESPPGGHSSRRSLVALLGFAGYLWLQEHSTRILRRWVFPDLLIPPCLFFPPEEYPLLVRPVNSMKEEAL